MVAEALMLGYINQADHDARRDAGSPAHGCREHRVLGAVAGQVARDLARRRETDAKVLVLDLIKDQWLIRLALSHGSTAPRVARFAMATTRLSWLLTSTFGFKYWASTSAGPGGPSSGPCFAPP